MCKVLVFTASCMEQCSSFLWTAAWRVLAEARRSRWFSTDKLDSVYPGGTCLLLQANTCLTHPSTLLELRHLGEQKTQLNSDSADGLSLSLGSQLDDAKGKKKQKHIKGEVTWVTSLSNSSRNIGTLHVGTCCCTCYN